MKIGPINVDTEIQQNPDTPPGTHCPNEMQQKARAVQEAKRKKKEIDEQKKATDLKNAQQAQKKLHAHTKILESVQKFSSDTQS